MYSCGPRYGGVLACVSVYLCTGVASAPGCEGVLVSLGASKYRCLLCAQWPPSSLQACWVAARQGPGHLAAPLVGTNQGLGWWQLPVWASALVLALWVPLLVVVVLFLHLPFARACLSPARLTNTCHRHRASLQSDLMHAAGAVGCMQQCCRAHAVCGCAVKSDRVLVDTMVLQLQNRTYRAVVLLAAHVQASHTCLTRPVLSTSLCGSSCAAWGVCCCAVSGVLWMA